MKRSTMTTYRLAAKHIHHVNAYALVASQNSMSSRFSRTPPYLQTLMWGRRSAIILHGKLDLMHRSLSMIKTRQHSDAIQRTG